jgi:hypothetical protein
MHVFSAGETGGERVVEGEKEEGMSVWEAREV